ncbi:hypothetical protein NQ317_002638 [Molorchus minor]|uniref:gamma-glutamylcyclotransferase n=1 Tax=Molorchus minor TaxID=1323400 RepID=A0ABQ9IYH9_9CUCU|nr:hypothetical protein NQ317_002638 [Molorchus minor]
MRMGGKFLYFAYGSNLLKQRIHINNPSAVRAGIAKLKDYQLDFVTYSKRWRGASATIVPKKGSHVWRALWEIDMTDMDNLDKRVHDNIYIPLMLEAEKFCWGQAEMSDIPEDRQPSAVYLNTILKGAIESGLPKDYQEFLKRIPHNGYVGDVDIGEI